MCGSDIPPTFQNAVPLTERLRLAGNKIVHFNFGRKIAELLFEAADALERKGQAAKDPT